MSKREFFADTHQVTNQPTALENYNAYLDDQVLQSYVTQLDADWAHEILSEFGHKVGGELLQAGFAANANKPEFQSHDRFGQRIDQVNYHPSYHQLMNSAISAGHHSLGWNAERPGGHVARAALTYLHTQADPGTGCPLTMTFASIPALKHQPEIAAEWLPKILTNQYDPDNKPYFEKNGLTVGMAMTEKQGGSDVRANTTRAYAIEQTGAGQAYELVGHKWFCSAPMCDGFLVLAQTDNGLGCFLLPRWRPDGSKNAMHIQRLKNKMGNVSNASSEVEFRGAFAWLIGEEGRGINTILEMVAMTRFDCMFGSTAIMQQACAQALHHTAGRKAFGEYLNRQPLMQNVLADLALEVEASLAISMRLAKALDSQDEKETQLFRLGTALGKYWICKRAAQHTYEAMESIGGVAVVEDNIVARLYRESPINAIWEGSGNVQALDVARAIEKSPEVLEVFLAELEKPLGQYPGYDTQLAKFKQSLGQIAANPALLRRQVEQMAKLWQASTLIQLAPAFIAEAFIRGRLENSAFQMYGCLPEGINFSAIIERARIKL